MKYVGTKEISKKWGINDRRVRLLCEEGRIDSAMKVGKSWLIREDEITDSNLSVHTFPWKTRSYRKSNNILIY